MASTINNKAEDSAVDVTRTKGFPCDWQITKYKLTQRGKQILETGQWADCKFIVGQEPHQQIIETHKLILTMASPVFEAMFFGEMAENNGPIPVTDIQPETFKAFLKYIYTDIIRLGSFEQACELGYCAKKYMFPFLDEECRKFVLSHLSSTKVCRAYEFAKLLAKPVLMEKCLEVIRTETDSVLKESSIEESQLETLITILEQEELRNSSEIELFSAAERWAKAECVRKSFDPEDSEAMRSDLGSALTKIRFLTLTLQELSASLANNSLLVKENETNAILWNISSGTLRRLMPEGFSTNMQRRKHPPCVESNSPMSLFIESFNETSETAKRKQFTKNDID